MVQRYDYSFPREPARACKREKKEEMGGGRREKSRGTKGMERAGMAGLVISRPLLSFYLRAQLANIIP